jgi:hypothetical protein
VTQLVGGRGTLSEMVLCATAIAIGAALTFWIAARAANSIGAGLAAALFQTVMMVRPYNYPKILVYAIAIPALWWFATRPGRARTILVAGVTAVAFLMRHDHGVFVAGAMAALLALMTDVPIRTRARLALLYAAAVVVLLLPYLLYLHDSGGVLLHVRTTMSWSARDRGRAPLVWPAFTTAIGDEANGAVPALFALAARNYEPWMFYLLVVLPFITAAMLWTVRDPLPGMSRSRPKLLMVAALAVALNVGFLRGALAARFADVSVPHAVLAAWAIATAARAAAYGDYGAKRLAHGGTRIVVAVVMVMVVGVTAIVQGAAFWGIDVDLTLARTREILTRYRDTWPLAAWADPQTPGTMQLAFYLNQCTQPSDHVFVSQYLPQVIALSGRPFAGGHGDLRPDFFNTVEQQQLTIARLSRQAVPVAVVPPPPEYGGFSESFPLIDRYFRERFRSAGVRDLGDHLVVELLVDKNRPPSGTFQRLDWPCFR